MPDPQGLPELQEPRAIPGQLGLLELLVRRGPWGLPELPVHRDP